MRIVWKDSSVKRSDFKYRGYWVEGYSNGGWTIDLPGDDNVYRTNRCAKNYIDEVLGIEGHRDKRAPKRMEHGYEVIGKRSNKTG